jgi:anion-transporting  ArsA/GET3 family ATPase
MPPLIDRLLQRQLIVVTGKGGVGKTTLTALLGQALAARGRKVLLLETDPRESLHHLLGGPPSAGERREAAPRLWYHNLDPRSVVVGLVRETVPLPLLARRVMASPAFGPFVDGAPGLREMATLGYACRSVEKGGADRVEVVVLDAPATGHAASLLAAPFLLRDAVAGGRLGDLAAEVEAFIADPARCGVVVAAVAEEMPVEEALELLALLKERMGRGPELLVINALHPPFPASPPAAEGALAELLELWRVRAELNRRELRRLRRARPGPTIELPLMAIEPGPALLQALAAWLDRGLATDERRR